MTATEGGPALEEANAAAPASADGGSGATARTWAPRQRTVLGLARVEASLLVRSLLVLAGLVVGGLVIWILIQSVEPLWWNAAWRIGFGQLVLGMAVLVAAQLAAGRPSRDGLADLYASFPATAATRTLAHLAGLAGAVPASLLLAGAATVVVQARGAIGAPGVVVLAGGLLLVIAAGAAGTAIGSRFPHPLAGVLGALALLLSSGTYRLASGAAIWLVPWEITQGQLGELPGPLAGYPPAGAHAVELAGIAVLAGIVALAVTVRHARARGGLAAAGIAAVAVICFAGALQLRPIPTADLNHLVSEVANPASVQRCTTANQVRRGVRLRHAARRRAARHRRRVPAGQRDDAPARTAGRPRLDGRVEQMAELAHHRRPARRRARHTDAQRPYQHSPSAEGDGRARTGQRAPEPAVY